MLISDIMRLMILSHRCFSSILLMELLQVQLVLWSQSVCLYLFQVKAAYFDRVNLSANGFYK